MDVISSYRKKPLPYGKYASFLKKAFHADFDVAFQEVN